MRFNRRNENHAEFHNRGKVTPFEFGLPEESTKFQTIRSILSNRGHLRVLHATRTKVGDRMDSSVSSQCRTIFVDNQLVNEIEYDWDRVLVQKI
ncbi:hypothetical protein [Bacillus thuringiensis]|uniref:hypothetical protein n=1 Tax=Bacillus thuringiensis TaxID=1428 RepID=UPI002AB57F08|nr:hypothetical protein [Bacillus thuringiensis]MDY7965686.1 hypothetical protein [Bacillus thuringiensis]